MNLFVKIVEECEVQTFDGEFVESIATIGLRNRKRMIRELSRQKVFAFAFLRENGKAEVWKRGNFVGIFSANVWNSYV